MTQRGVLNILIYECNFSRTFCIYTFILDLQSKKLDCAQHALCIDHKVMLLNIIKYEQAIEGHCHGLMPKHVFIE